MKKNTYVIGVLLALLWSCTKDSTSDSDSNAQEAKQREQLTKLNVSGFKLQPIVWKSKAGTELETIAVIAPAANQAVYYKWRATGAGKTYEGIGYAPSFEICDLPPGDYKLQFTGCRFADKPGAEICGQRISQDIRRTVTAETPAGSTELTSLQYNRCGYRQELLHEAHTFLVSPLFFQYLCYC